MVVRFAWAVIVSWAAWSAVAAQTIPVHVIAFTIDANGLFQPGSHRIAEWPTPLKSATEADVREALRQPDFPLNSSRPVVITAFRSKGHVVWRSIVPVTVREIHEAPPPPGELCIDCVHVRPIEAPAFYFAIPRDGVVSIRIEGWEGTHAATFSIRQLSELPE